MTKQTVLLLVSLCSGAVRLVGKKRRQQSFSAGLGCSASRPDMTIMVFTSLFLIGYEAHSTGGTSCLVRKPMTKGDHRPWGQGGKPTIVLINGQAVKVPSKHLFIATDLCLSPLWTEHFLLMMGSSQCTDPYLVQGLSINT